MDDATKFKIKAYLLTGHNGSDLIDLLWDHISDEFKIHCLEGIIELTEMGDKLDYDHLSHKYVCAPTLEIEHSTIWTQN